ncbi:MAG: DUF3179 domain-containing protein [Chloroflexota bacterium]
MINAQKTTDTRRYVLWGLVALLLLATYGIFTLWSSESNRGTTVVSSQQSIRESERGSTDDSAKGESFVNDENITIFTEDDRPSRIRSATAGWNTDWTRRTIQYDELLSGGPPRDGIPSLDNPAFETYAEAALWLANNEPVISVEINDEARAYPLQILTWHEIVNDEVGGVPVAVTFCPLCNSALVFDRRFDGEIFEFGTSGLLRKSDLVMYDRTTESLWQQFTGEGIVGELAGRQLDFVPSSIVSFADFQKAFPEGVVLSQNTGFTRSYGTNPYAGYDSIDSSPFLFDGDLDGRLLPMARVVTISLADRDLAYPVEMLADVGVINDVQGEQALVVFHTDGTSSALGAGVIANAEDVGATGVFDPTVDGQVLTFTKDGNRIFDEQTGSEWNILGYAISGELADKSLTPIVHADHFWFSWAAFKPDTIVYSQ